MTSIIIALGLNAVQIEVIRTMTSRTNMTSTSGMTLI